MDKKEVLLRSLIELKAAHEKANTALAEIMTAAANAAKGKDDHPAIADLRQYKQAITAAKLHASQAEMLLVDYIIPAIPADDQRKPAYMQ